MKGILIIATLIFGSLACLLGFNAYEANRAVSYSCGWFDAQQAYIIKIRAMAGENDNSDLLRMPECDRTRVIAARHGFRRPL